MEEVVAEGEASDALQVGEESFGFSVGENPREDGDVGEDEKDGGDRVGESGKRVGNLREGEVTVVISGVKNGKDSADNEADDGGFPRFFEPWQDVFEDSGSADDNAEEDMGEGVGNPSEDAAAEAICPFIQSHCEDLGKIALLVNDDGVFDFSMESVEIFKCVEDEIWLDGGEEINDRGEVEQSFAFPGDVNKGEETADGIWDEDIARPQQTDMEEPDDQKDTHPAADEGVEAMAFGNGSAVEDGEADAEKDGEDREKFTPKKDGNGFPDDEVWQSAEVGLAEQVAFVGELKAAHVDDEDPEKGESAEGVEEGVSSGVGGLAHAGCRIKVDYWGFVNFESGWGA